MWDRGFRRNSFCKLLMYHTWIARTTRTVFFCHLMYNNICSLMSGTKTHGCGTQGYEYVFRAMWYEHVGVFKEKITADTRTRRMSATVNTRGRQQQDQHNVAPRTSENLFYCWRLYGVLHLWCASPFCKWYGIWCFFGEIFFHSSYLGTCPVTTD